MRSRDRLRPSALHTHALGLQIVCVNSPALTFQALESHITTLNVGQQTAATGIELRAAGLDESPDRHKRLDEVLVAVGDTVCILHRPTTMSVAMAGANEFDPYKD